MHGLHITETRLETSINASVTSTLTVNINANANRDIQNHRPPLPRHRHNRC